MSGGSKSSRVRSRKPGDVVLYKIGRCFAHGALIVEPGWPEIIHAHFAARRVRRANGLNPQLRTRVLERRFFSLFVTEQTRGACDRRHSGEMTRWPTAELVVQCANLWWSGFDP